MYALLSELLHGSLCNLPTFYNLSKIDLLSLRLSSNKCGLVISATRIVLCLGLFWYSYINSLYILCSI